MAKGRTISSLQKIEVVRPTMMQLPDEQRREEIEAAQGDRLYLWREACAKRITVEQLYERLAELRRRFGGTLYPPRSIQPKYPRE